MPRSLILGAAVTLLLTGGAVTLAGASSPAGGGQRHHVLHVSRDTGQDIYPRPRPLRDAEPARHRHRR